MTIYRWADLLNRPIFIKQRFRWWINKMVSKVHLVFDFYSSLYYFTSSNGYCCKLNTVQNCASQNFVAFSEYMNFNTVQNCALVTTFLKPRPFGLLPAFPPTCGQQHDDWRMLGGAPYLILLQTIQPTALRSKLLNCAVMKD